LLFARVENFINAFSETIEHPQPWRSGTVEGVRNCDAFVLPPTLLGVKRREVRDILQPTL